MDGMGQRAHKPTELELLQMRMNATTNESLAATQRILKHADEAEKTGAATMQQLAVQGDKLRRVDEDMDEIHHGVKEADQNLADLEKCCGICICPCNRYKKPHTKTYYDSRHRTTSYRSKNGGDSTLKRPGSGVISDQPNISGQGQYVTRILNDKREDEMEENLQKTGQIVGNLHQMATEMNREIKTHNEILGRIDAKADANKTKIAEAQGRAEHYLGKPVKPEPQAPSQAAIGLAAAKYMMK